MTGPAAVDQSEVWSEDISGLRPINLRPPLGEYIADIWRRRHFLRVFAAAQQESSATTNRLGRYWFVLSPILSAITYWFVFGVLLGVDKGVENFVGFLVTGIFFFSFTSGAVSGGAGSLAGSADLIRSLHFPRAAIPLSTTIMMAYRLGWELLVLCGVVLITGEPLTWNWLLLPLVVAVQAVFNAGLALGMARLGSQVRDIRQVLPFVTRTWMFMSGVIFPLDRFAGNTPAPVQFLLEINPAAVYVNLARDALMASETAPPGSWTLAVAWAVVVFVLCFIYFWRAEARYGRV